MVSGMGLKELIKALLQRLPIGYYNGNLYKLNTKNQEMSSAVAANKNFKPWILIVSRDYYQESVDKLPIVDQKEIKQILQLKRAEVLGDNVYIINTVTENQTFYNLWKFNPSLPTSWFRLPESLLIARCLGEDVATTLEIEDKQTRLYVGSSSQGVYSAKPTGMLNSLSRFCQSCGLVAQTNSPIIVTSQFYAVLVEGLLALTSKDWLTFSCSPKNNFSYQSIKIPLWLTAGCIAAYLAVGSAYIVWKKHNLEQQLLGSKVELTAALNTQDNMASLQQQVSSMSGFASALKSKMSIWQVLLPLYSEAQFTNISFDNGRFILRGTADRATQLLAKLALMRGVSEAQFDLPVSKSRNLENFTISFRIQTEALGGNNADPA
jgi:hypothetical protein